MDRVRHQGELNAGTHEQRLILLAGALAESGIAELQLEPDNVTLHARRTDLPGYLARAGSAELTLRAANDTLLRINRSSIAWATTHEHLADRLRRAQG